MKNSTNFLKPCSISVLPCYNFWLKPMSPTLRIASVVFRDLDVDDFRSSLSAETLWVGGWLLPQLLPNREEELTTNHLKQLRYPSASGSSLAESLKDHTHAILLSHGELDVS